MGIGTGILVHLCSSMWISTIASFCTVDWWQSTHTGLSLTLWTFSVSFSQAAMPTFSFSACKLPFILQILLRSVQTSASPQETLFHLCIALLQHLWTNVIHGGVLISRYGRISPFHIEDRDSSDSLWSHSTDSPSNYLHLFLWYRLSLFQL